MKKIMSLVITGVLAAATVVAAPVAAQAAPKSFDLPKNCESFYGKKKIPAKNAFAQQADVHPNKGKEYVYTVGCLNQDYSVTDRVVVTNSKGKVLTSAVIGKNTFSVVSSATKKSGIKLSTFQGYKGNTSYERVDTAKVNAKSKKIKVTKGKTPGYVKPTHNLGAQLATGKKITAVKGSKADLKKLSNFGKTYKKAAAKDRFISCIQTKSATKGICGITYVKGSKEYYTSFEIAKSGKNYKVSKVKTASAKLPSF